MGTTSLSTEPTEARRRVPLTERCIRKRTLLHSKVSGFSKDLAADFDLAEVMEQPCDADVLHIEPG